MTPLAATLLCLGLSLLYVGSIHAWPTHEHTQHRDHPSTIQRRLASVTLTSAASGLVVLQLLQPPGAPAAAPWAALAPRLGLRAPGLWQAALYPLLLTMALFLGPMLLKCRDYRANRRGAGSAAEALAHTFQLGSHAPAVRRWVVVRSLAVAPLTEEWVYRACMAAPLAAAGVSVWAITFLSPLAFGVAHAHHLWLARGSEPREWRTARQQAAFQACYTTVFGWYVAWLFVRTGHLVAPVLTHVFCNAMQFPPFGRLLADGATKAALGLGVALFVGGLPYATSCDLFSGSPYCAE